MYTFVITIALFAGSMAILSLAAPILEKFNTLRKQKFHVEIPKKRLNYYKGINQKKRDEKEYVLTRGL